ncbi:putative Calnexin like protein [Blattamonas nauphoetae]|uniref:Calnexin like protein n=1 Tax=Blattamonas nauphoetae TaxID=2049346 RepID=A0ABQ9XCL0_9EUKA|nr:putative Calnexin like protein [Blattamonas nauphoetae]
MLFLLLGSVLVQSKILFYEDFNQKNVSSRWIPSRHRDYTGTFKLQERKSDVLNTHRKGMVAISDRAFHGISTKLSEQTGNDNFVFQYEVKVQNKNYKCGGGYMKIYNQPFRPEHLLRNTSFSVLFGPDRCGGPASIRLVFRMRNPFTNAVTEHALTQTKFVLFDEKLSHVYTLALNKTDCTFQILIDGTPEITGSLYDPDMFDPPIFPPEYIPDPEDVKPADWVDTETIDDPTDVKPDWWDIQTVSQWMDDPLESDPYPDEPGDPLPKGAKNKGQSTKLVAPNDYQIPNYDPIYKFVSTQRVAPAEWNEEEDGPFEPLLEVVLISEHEETNQRKQPPPPPPSSLDDMLNEDGLCEKGNTDCGKDEEEQPAQPSPPKRSGAKTGWRPHQIQNPQWRGKWKPRQIPNPAYKGPWRPRMIMNPDYYPLAKRKVEEAQARKQQEMLERSENGTAEEGKSILDEDPLQAILALEQKIGGKGEAVSKWKPTLRPENPTPDETLEEKIELGYHRLVGRVFGVGIDVWQADANAMLFDHVLLATTLEEAEAVRNFSFVERHKLEKRERARELNRDIVAMERGAWKDLALDGLDAVVDWFRDLPCRVLSIGCPEEEEDEDAGRKKAKMVDPTKPNDKDEDDDEKSWFERAKKDVRAVKEDWQKKRSVLIVVVQLACLVLGLFVCVCVWAILAERKERAPKKGKKKTD